MCSQQDDPTQHDPPAPADSVITAEGVEQGPRRNESYEALGIFPDTFACVAVLLEDDARDLTWRLAQAGLGVRVTRDPNGRRWHVATPGGLGYSPMAWLLTIRDVVPTVCITPEVRGQHPQVEIVAELA